MILSAIWEYFWPTPEPVVQTLSSPPPKQLGINVPNAPFHLKNSPAHEYADVWNRDGYLRQVEKYVPQISTFTFKRSATFRDALQLLYCNKHVHYSHGQLIANNKPLGNITFRIWDKEHVFEIHKLVVAKPLNPSLLRTKSMTFP